MAGPGVLELDNNNLYPGATTIQGGTLVVNGSQSQSAVLIQGGTLAGAGTVGPITNAVGTISPGPVHGTGILQSVGSLVLQSGSTFSPRLNGVTPGTFLLRSLFIRSLFVLHCSLH